MSHRTAHNSLSPFPILFYILFFQKKQKQILLKSRNDIELHEMQTLVDNLKGEIVSLSNKREEDLLQQQQQQRKHFDGQLVEDLRHRLIESENLIQIKSEQVYQCYLFFY